MTFNIIYWDMAVCISNRPAGTSVRLCACACVMEKGGRKEGKEEHAVENAHACVCEFMQVCTKHTSFFGSKDSFFLTEEIVADWVSDQMCLGQREGGLCDDCL